MIKKNFKLILYIALVMGASCLLGCTQLMGDSDNPANDPPGQMGGKGHSHRSSYRSTLVGGKVGQTFLDMSDASYNTSNNGNYWDHLRSDFQLPDASNEPAVQAQINWFMHNRDYFYRTISHAGPYMYFILQQAEQRNLPGELVLLPVLESDYNPFAKNPSGALGMWQLMRDTASGFGVKEDFWFDGRRDIYASTNAALDYLTYLQSYFGDNWLLAIAAYDTGEGNVQNAIRRNERDNKPTDFWSLSLAAETRSYVPRLLAIASIIRNPAKYGFTLPNINDQPYLAQIDIGVPINLSKAALMAGMSLDDLKRLNPGYSRSTTDPNGPYKLILPIDRVAMFKQQVNSMHGLPVTTWGRYKIQHGDSFASIAARFHTTAEEIREANHIKSHAAPVGKIIMIPSGTQVVSAHISSDDNNTSEKSNETITQASMANANNPLTQTMPNVGPTQLTNDSDNTDESSTNDDQAKDTTTSQKVKHTHLVKKGETFSSIAKHLGVTSTDLRHWNKTKSSKALKPGMEIVYFKSQSIKTNPAHSSSKEQQVAKGTKKSPKTLAKNSTKTNQHKTIRPNHYTVKSGDNISKIAHHLGIKSADLRKWNHLSSASKLKPGEELVVH